MSFKPDLSTIRQWVESGALASDLDAEARTQLTDSEAGRAILSDYASVFNSEAGRRVQAHLAQSTVFRAPVDHRLSGADYVAYVQLRQGQNQIFAMIQELLMLADKLENEHVYSRSGTERGGEPGTGWPVSRGDFSGGTGAGAIIERGRDGDGWSGFDVGGAISL